MTVIWLLNASNRKNPNQVDTRTVRVLMEVAELHRKHLGGQLLFSPNGLLHIILGDGMITLDDMEEMDGLRWAWKWMELFFYVYTLTILKFELHLIFYLYNSSLAFVWWAAVTSQALCWGWTWTQIPARRPTPYPGTIPTLTVQISRLKFLHMDYTIQAGKGQQMEVFCIKKKFSYRGRCTHRK